MIYLDRVFLVNMLADLAVLVGTVRLAGIRIAFPRVLLGAVLGGVYGVLCALWPAAAASAAVGLAAAVALVRVVFGKSRCGLRLFALFCILSCALGGAVVGVRTIASSQTGDPMTRINWKVFLLATVLCFGMLTLLLKDGAAHGVKGQLRQIRLMREGRSVTLTALLDSGHTLKDSRTGGSILIAERRALLPLFDREERDALALFGVLPNSELIRRLPAERFFLQPYRAVGVSEGTLLCFRAERVIKDGRLAVTAALCPTPLGGKGYCALWGAEERENEDAV